MGVSILDELIALGLEYCFQDLPEVVSPRAVFSVCSLLLLLSDLIVTSQLLDFVTILLFSNRKKKMHLRVSSEDCLLLTVKCVFCDCICFY